MLLKIVNPATGEEIRELEQDNAASIRARYERARAAQPGWARTSLEERIGKLKRFRELIVERKDWLAKTLTSEVGKPVKQSHNEINGMLGRLDWFLENVGKHTQSETVMNDPAGKLVEKIGYEPLGVIANISAWNYPYLVGCNVFVPALLTGNTVLYKPSEFATLTGLAIAESLHEAGIPKDVFIPVIGTGNAGAELLKLPINGVFFTGSFATGKKIAEAVAGRMIKVQLELGGKDPIYVADDADVATVAPGVADGAFYNNGQSCCSVERIYVHEKVYDKFLESFVNEVKTWKVGDPMDEKTYIGPLTRGVQLELLAKQVADAQKKGARLLHGGHRAKGQEYVKGWYFEPTVFSNVTHDMELMREESFGPIIGIQKVRDDEEALQLMNDSEYGLTAGVYTPDRARAEKLLARVNAGSAYWNCCDRVSPRLPWTGRGHSGMGSTLSHLGIQAFVQPKAWHLRG